MTYRRYIITVVLLGLASTRAYARSQCEALAPTATKEVSESFKGQIEGKISEIVGRMAGSQVDLNGEYQSFVRDTLKEYPDSNRLFVWERIIYLSCIKGGIDINRLSELYLIGPPGSDPTLDLEWLSIGISQSFVEAKLGPSLTVRIREVWDSLNDSREEAKEHYFSYGGASVRVVFGEDQLARSIFVGLDKDAEQVFLAGPGEWPIRWGGTRKRRWSDFRFGDVADIYCEQWVNYSMSASINSATCEYTHWPSGSSTYDGEECLMSAGYSDGAFGVHLVSPSPDITSFDVKELKSDGASEDEVSHLIWNKTKDTLFNYIMIACDGKYILQG